MMDAPIALPAPPGPPLVDLAAALPEGSWPALFDGGPQATPLARWDMLAWDPIETLSLVGQDAPVTRPQERALGQLEALLDRHFPGRVHDPPPTGDDLPPFRGGAVALLAFDLGRELERLPCLRPRDAELPDLLAAVHRFVLAEERATGRRLVVGRGSPAQAQEFLRRVEALSRHATPPPAGLPPVRELSSSFDRAGFEAAVEAVREHILSGRVYQVNLAQRLQARWSGRAADLQRALRLASPAPFGGLFACPGLAFVSSSPELFLRRRGEHVSSRPIKGTRPRGRLPADDERLRRELESSPKERAELAMIVDLVRNDLGRSARLGSVQVALPFETDAWSTVFHRVAEVGAEVPRAVSTGKLVERAFPPASVSGTPKLSALAVIEELEPVRRHFYTGAFGWIDASGDCDLAVAIRVATLVGERLLVPVGGGITLASEPAAEYEETLHKAAGALAALGLPPDVPLGTR